MTRQFYVVLCVACFILQQVFCNVPQETRFKCLEVKGEELCCPYKDGHFCKDQLSCCPYGTTCNEERTACEQRNPLPFLTWKTESAVPLIPNPETPVPYPANPSNCGPVAPEGPLYIGSRAFQCPMNTTYCEDAYRFGFTCCPLQNATCCGDFAHCCPQGTQCDLTKGLCLTESNPQQNWLRVFHATTPSKANPPKVDRQLPPIPFSTFKSKSCPGPFGRECPDNSSCPDSATCCSFGDQSYGCCPISNAVCCSDHLHCCPSGTTCNLSQGTCESKLSYKVWLDDAKKMMDQIVCPGGDYVCPDGTTCCSIGFGQYGCCPFPNAVCCSDNAHCCPYGTTCNLSQGTCERQNLVTGQGVVRKAKKFGDVVCPGGKYVCPDKTTCCDVGRGKYACCPLPNAVCCSDKMHCCPYGTKCSLSTDSCIRSAGTSTKLFKKQPACRVGPRRPY